MRPAGSLCALLLVAAACAADESPPPGEISSDAVLAHARALAIEIGPRPSDTDASARAAAYIESQLGGLAVERLPVGRIELPPVDVGPFRWLEGRVVEVADENLLVGFPGTAGGPAILFMAHYDTVPESPGAADNAASVGVLLELARALAGRPPARPVLIAFTAAEEKGLAGARALAPRLLTGAPPVGLAVSLDLVGAAPTALNGLSDLIGRRWLGWLAARMEESGADLEVPIPHRVMSRLGPGAERSDHAAFTERGVPAFHLYGRGDDRIYLAYHTRWDLPDRLDPRVLADTGRFVTALARSTGELPAAGGDPGFWLPGTHVVLPGLLVLGLELSLAVLVLVLLWHLWRTRERDPGRRGFGLIATTLLVPLLWLLAHLFLQLARADHPLPWAHAPGVGILVALLVVASAAALAWVSPLGRLRLVGRRRYAAAGALPLLLAGAGLIAIGAREMAWAPLASAALIAAASLAPGRAAPLVVFALSLVPLAPILSPAFLRESAFHGLYPPGFPLPFFLAIVLTPHALALVPLLRRALPERNALPRWSAAVPGALLVGLFIAAALVARGVPCDPSSFERLGLACEIAPE